MTLPGDHAVPQVQLRGPDHASAGIYLHGAQVASWKTSDGREQLFFSDRADFDPASALRGGVPIAFPQFSRFGPLPAHGFARTQPWGHLPADSDPASAAADSAQFHLQDSAATRAIWNHAFQLDFTVTVGGDQLHMALHVTNSGAEPFDFTAALHTYLRVDDIAAVTVAGLGGRPYQEHGEDGVQTESPLRVQGEIDRIYWHVPEPVTVADGGHTVQVAKSGFPDIVVWNPGPEKGAALPDLAPDGYRVMLCVEAVVIGDAVILAPGAQWTGTQTLTVR